VPGLDQCRKQPVGDPVGRLDRRAVVERDDIRLEAPVVTNGTACFPSLPGLSAA